MPCRPRAPECRRRERVCCLLVLYSVTSTLQWIRQPKPRGGRLAVISYRTLTVQYILHRRSEAPSSRSYTFGPTIYPSPLRSDLKPNFKASVCVCGGGVMLPSRVSWLHTHMRMCALVCEHVRAGGVCYCVWRGGREVMRPWRVPCSPEKGFLKKRGMPARCTSVGVMLGVCVGVCAL